jgi:hypothetical protein
LVVVLTKPRKRARRHQGSGDGAVVLVDHDPDDGWAAQITIGKAPSRRAHRGQNRNPLQQPHARHAQSYTTFDASFFRADHAPLVDHAASYVHDSNIIGVVDASDAAGVLSTLQDGTFDMSRNHWEAWPDEWHFGVATCHGQVDTSERLALIPNVGPHADVLTSTVADARYQR